MQTEINTEALNRDVRMLSRALSIIAIILACVAIAVNAAPILT